MRSACSSIVVANFVARRRVTDSLLDSGDLTADLVTVPVRLLTAALQDLPTLAPVLASYVPVFAAAIVFVRWNGGHIVLGKSAHAGLSLSLSEKLEQTGSAKRHWPYLSLEYRRQVEPRPDCSCRPSLVLPRLCGLLLLAAPPRPFATQAKHFGRAANTEVRRKIASLLVFLEERVADWRGVLNRAVASSARSWRSG